MIRDRSKGGPYVRRDRKQKEFALDPKQTSVKEHARPKVTSADVLLGRRQALKYAALAGTSVVAVSALAGCGSSADAGDSASSDEDIVSDSLLRCEFPSTDAPGVLLPGEGEDLNGMLVKADYHWLSGGFSMMETTIEGKQLLAPHRHQYADQVVVVLGGAGLLQFQFGVDEDEETSDILDAPVGSYVIKPRGISHTFWNPGPVPVPYIELSTRTQFQDFVRTTAEDDSLDAIEAAGAKYYTTFLDSLIPELLVKHGLTSIKGMGGISPSDAVCAAYPCED